MSRAILEAIAKSKASKGGNFIRAGKYLFEIQNVSAEKCFGGDMFIVEFVVLEAVKTGEKDRAGKEIEPNPVGSSCSYVVNLGKVAGPGNAKSFAMALFDEPEEAITVEALEELCAPASFDKDGNPVGQPCRFLQLRDEAFNRAQRGDASKDFTKHRWEHVAPTPEFLAQVSQRRIAERKAK